MKKIEQKVLKFIDEKNLISKNDIVLVALSGGPDSVFLLYFLNKFKKRFQISIGVFHLNHKLRGKNSDDDLIFCKNLSDKMKIDFLSSAKNIKQFAKENKISIEEAGRKIRYEELHRIAEKNNYNKIATAHIADDNTETVLLNLIKGTGLKGISGIPIKRGNIIRPILILTKKEILEYLHYYEIDYRVDESNLSIDYERNFLRSEVIPLIKKN
ncbi:MAG: tRNA lysidine(34) synthetase TilS [Ignavibacteriaceae bacterium]